MSAGQEPGSGPPPSSQVGPPVELYPMTDLRFVLTRIGELSAKIDRLVTDAGDQSRKVSEIRDMIAFVRGAVWVIG